MVFPSEDELVELDRDCLHLFCALTHDPRAIA
jgi:hypothetical protein